MKTYKVKNYKGNLVESLKKFSDLHKGMKIVEAVEDGDDLKIKAEESKQKVEEATGQSVYVLWREEDYGDAYDILGIYSQKEKAIAAAQKRKIDNDKDVELRVYPLDKYVVNYAGKPEGDWERIEM